MIYSNIVTATNPSFDIREEILSLLKLSPVPLTATDLRVKLRVLLLQLPEYEILRELRSLRKEGLVRLEGGSWKATSPFAKKPVIQQTTPPKAPSRPTIIRKPLADGWTPSKSWLFATAVKPEPQPLPESIPQPFEKPDFSGSWGMFRKLLGYYVDCVRNDEGCEASGFLQDYEDRFIFLNQVGVWYPRPGQPWRLALPLGPNLQHFIKRLALLGDGGVLVLGYPFQVFVRPASNGPEAVFVKPIFTYQLLWQPRVNILQVWNDDPCPEINLDWLMYALKNPDQQKMFLATCGLMDRGRIDESFGDGSQFSYAPDLSTLASGISTFFGDSIRDPLRPDCVSAAALPAKPLSGIYNRAVLMIGNRARYTKSLLKELNKIVSCKDEELDKTALKFIFKSQDTSQGKTDSLQTQTVPDKNVHEGLVIDTCPLNGEQREAAASLLNENISIITGPPGTGKSQVVSAAMVNGRLFNQTVLFASRNHKALDSVVYRLVSSDHKPLIARANSKEDSSFKFGFLEALSQLLVEEHDEGAEDKWTSIEIQLANLLKNRGSLGFQANKAQELKDRLGLLEQHMAELSESWSPEAILDLSKGPQHFPSEKLRKLDRSIGILRQPGYTSGPFDKYIWWIKGIWLHPKAKDIEMILSQYFKSWQLDLSSKGSRCLKKVSTQIPQLFKAEEFCSLQVNAKPIEAELQELPLIEDLVPKIKKLSDRLTELSPQAILLHLGHCTGLPRGANREEFAALKSALRGLDHPVSDKADRETAEAALNRLLPSLLKHFPLWAVTNLAVSSRIPLIPGLFDLAILDEASQCDIPSAIPIIFRAKRIGVVGDPHQLSHSTKLSRTHDSLLRKRHALVQLKEQRFSYPDNSLYDLFSQTNEINPIFLKDTYRSVEDIAEYSNQTFYGGRLRVATMADRLRIPKNVKPGIHWTEIVSEIRSGGPSGCFAPEEIEAVIKSVREILVENQFEGTLGVVTPFRQQANRLQDRIYEEIPVEVRRSAQVIVDTAHGFQGDERDVIIMSLCAGPEMPRGSRAFLRETANLMNVGVSRARAVLQVVGNRSWASQSGIPHLESLAVQPKKASRPKDPLKSPWYPHESPWEKILFDALMSRGIEAESQYPILGRRLDLALVKKGKNGLKIDIEVDGDRYHRNPDGSRKRDDVWRDIQLQGAGWKVMRFWVYQLREDLDKCVHKIIKAWSYHD
jgi:very-short-patch-repair endonuclease